MKQAIVANGVEQYGGNPHAIRVGETLYVGGRIAKSKETPDSTREQVDQIARDLDTILKSAGFSLSDVAKINGYFDRLEDRVAVAEARPKYFPKYYYTMTNVIGHMADKAMNVQFELVAAREREPFITPQVYQVGDLAHAVKVSNILYVQGQIGWETVLRPELSGSKEEVTAGRFSTRILEGIDAQTKRAFACLDSILKAADCSWEDVVRARTYLAHRQDLSAIRRIQSKYLNARLWLATEIVTPLILPGLLVEVELDVIIGPKQSVTSPDVFQSQSLPHAVKAGRTIYTGCQFAWDRQGKLVGSDVGSQSSRIFENLETILKAAGASLKDVIKINSYVTRRELFEPARDARARYISPSQAVVTEVMTSLPEAEMLIGVECIAAVE